MNDIAPITMRPASRGSMNPLVGLYSVSGGGKT
jgi:hypothetical protein